MGDLFDTEANLPIEVISQLSRKAQKRLLGNDLLRKIKKTKFDPMRKPLIAIAKRTKIPYYKLRKITFEEADVLMQAAEHRTNNPKEPT